MLENRVANLAAMVALAMIAMAAVVSPHDGCLVEQGRIPFGNVGAIEVDGERLVYGSGTALVVDDVADPRNPRRQGSIDLRAEILGLDVADHFAFAVTELGLHVIDIAHPRHLRQIGFETTPHAARAVQVYDRWAYVAGGEGLSLINIRIPSAPWLALSDLSPICDYNDLALQYPLLYTIGCGLEVIDVSRPMFPTTIARLEIGGKRIAVEGSVAAVVGVDRLRLIDLSDLSDPIERGSIWTHGPASDVALMGETAVSGSVAGLSVFDIGRLEAPAESAHIALSGGVASIAAADGLIYLANLASLRVVSLDDPSAPNGIARVANPTFGRISTNRGVAVTTHAYSGPRADMITVLDIGRRVPSDIGSWQTLWGPEDVAVDGSRALVTADGGLYALDLDDPASPVELGFLDLIESEHLALDSSRAYVATMGVAGFPSFVVVDVSDPSDMMQLGRHDWERGGPYPTAVDASGDIAVVADIAGLRVLDVGDPQHVRLVGRLERYGSIAVALVGNHAVLGYSSPTQPDDRGVDIVDLTTREGPSAVGSWSSPDTVTAVVEFGGAVLVGTRTDGVFLLDLDEPSRPIEVDHWALGRAAVVDLTAAWPKAVVSHGTLGLTVLSYDVSCGLPRRPSRRASPSGTAARYDSISAEAPVSLLPPS